MENKLEVNVTQILEDISLRKKEENSAFALSTIETLRKLGVSVGDLPRKCRDLVNSAAKLQSACEIETLDPIVVSLKYSEILMEEMDDEYELLKLKQKNLELDNRIKKNTGEIASLKNKVEEAKSSLMNQNPNPETILDEISVLKQKVTSYDKSYDKIKLKFEKLNVPAELYPKSLEELVLQLEALKSEELDLKDRADQITLAKSAKQKLLQLKAAKF